MGNTFFFGWEVDLIVWLQNFVNGFTTLPAKFLQISGEEYVLIFVLGLLYWSIDKKPGRRASLAMAGSMVFGTLIKGLALRRRPYMDNAQVNCITAPRKGADIFSVKEQGYSFPGLPSAMAAATYGTVAVSTKKSHRGDRHPCAVPDRTFPPLHRRADRPAFGRDLPFCARWDRKQIRL